MWDSFDIALEWYAILRFLGILMMTSSCSAVTVAVVIPFYNGSKWIERALISVVQQTLPADEVIVVNDGSSAKERAGLECLVDKYSIRIIDKENGGQGSARNAGVDVATSEYICFLDQDDFYIPEHIEMLVDAIPRKDLRFGFVYGDIIEADGDGNIIRVAWVKEVNSAHPKRNIFQMLRHDSFILPSAAIINRKAFLDVGGFDPCFTGYEDDDLFLRLFRKGYTNYFLDKPVYVWCIHGESTSYSIKMIRSRFRYFSKLVKAFPDDKDRGRYYLRDYLAPRFTKLFLIDALKAVETRGEYGDEIISIFREYASIVYQNQYVGVRYKAKLWLLTFVVSVFPYGVISVLKTAVKVRWIRRLLG